MAQKIPEVGILFDDQGQVSYDHFQTVCPGFSQAQYEYFVSLVPRSWQFTFLIDPRGHQYRKSSPVKALLRIDTKIASHVYQKMLRVKRVTPIAIAKWGMDLVGPTRDEDSIN